MEVVAARFAPDQDLTKDPLTALFAFLTQEKTRPEASKDNLTFLVVDRGGSPMPDNTNEG